MSIQSESFTDRLRRFGDMSPGWDSYGAKEIDVDCIHKALELYERLPPGPWIPVPCSDGGVQIEQHADGFDIEIMISKA